MDGFAQRFVKSSLVWLCLGITLGLAMAIVPAWAVYRPAHMHMNMLGFVTMMIFGVGYHVLPRFVGARLWSRTLGGWHWWMSNVGLALMVLGFALRVMPRAQLALGTAMLGFGAFLSAAGAYALAFNMWRTMGGPSTVRLGRNVRRTAAEQRPQTETAGR